MPLDDVYTTGHAQLTYVFVRLEANLRACFFFSSVTGPDQMFAVDVLHAN